MKAFNFKSTLVAFFVCFSVWGHAQTRVYEKFNTFKENHINNCSEDTIYVINFWATWCVPCVKELPYFQKIDGTLIKKTPIKVTLVSLDFPSNIESKLVPFLKKKNIQNEVVVLADGDANSWISQIDMEWDGAIPATLIIYKNKKYFFRKSYTTIEELTTEIQTLIN